jgi:hypothetical protein
MQSIHRGLVPCWVLGVVALSACAGEPANAPVTSALTQGRVDAASGPASGVEVRAFIVREDGSLDAASEIVRTNTSGRYEIEASIDDSTTAIVVRVEDGSGRMSLLDRAVVDVSTRDDTSLTMPPIGVASTFDADTRIAVERRVDGAGPEAALDSVLLPHALSAELAREARARDVAVEAAADAIVSARGAFVATLATDADANARVAFERMIESEARLAGALDAARDDVEARAAYATHFDASIEAMTDAGYDLDAVARAAITARAAEVIHLEGHVPSGAASLSGFTTYATTAAIEVGFVHRFDAPAVADTGASLRAEMLGLADARGDAAAVKDVWIEYGTAIETAVLSRSGLLASSLIDLDAALDTSADALHARWDALGTDATAEARVEAYASYLDEAVSSGHASILLTAGLTEEETAAALDAMATVAVLRR